MSLSVDNYRMNWYVLKVGGNIWHVDGCIINRLTQETISFIVPENPEDIPPEAIATPTPVPEATATPEPTTATGGYLKLDNNSAYIFGRSDSAMEPEDNMKCGEAAAALYRLLKQNNALGSFSYDPDKAPTLDYMAGRWDRSALEYMTYIGVYSDSEIIRPDANITRGEAFKEFAIALKFTTDTSLTQADYAALLKDSGFVEGDENGDLALNRSITRAEFCKIYNMIIGRDDLELVTADGEEVTPETYGFEDIESGAWYYADVLKATSAYDDNGYVDLVNRGKRNVLDDYS